MHDTTYALLVTRCRQYARPCPGHKAQSSFCQQETYPRPRNPKHGTHATSWTDALTTTSRKWVETRLVLPTCCSKPHGPQSNYPARLYVWEPTYCITHSQRSRGGSPDLPRGLCGYGMVMPISYTNTRSITTEHKPLERDVDGCRDHSRAARVYTLAWHRLCHSPEQHLP